MQDIIKIDELIQRGEVDIPFWYPFRVVIDALGKDQRKLQIGNDGDFYCQYIVGQYTTKILDDQTPVDGGANGISVKLSDNGWNVPLFDEMIPVSMWLTPGRQRTSGVAGDPSHQLFFPMEFDHVFLATTSIQIEYASTLDYENQLEIVFMGRKFRKAFNLPERNAVG